MFKKQLDNSQGNHTDSNNMEDIKADWKDILAMIIATYQVILPFLAILVGIFVVLGLLASRWFKY